MLQSHRVASLFILLAALTGIRAEGPTDHPTVNASLPVITADFSKSLGAFNHSPGRAVSATPGRSQFNALAYAHLTALDLDFVRVWIRNSELFHAETKKPTYAGNLTEQCLKKYSPITKKILINLQFGPLYRDLVEKKGWSEAEYMEAMTRVLDYYKSKYPKIEYVEVDNEPNALKPQKYYFTYSKACSVVARVNDKIKTGALSGPLLLVGGPTLYKFDATENKKWMEPFLDAYVADPSNDKRLDFISYHQYLLREKGEQDPLIHKDSPSRAADIRLIDEGLRQRKLPIVPILITEGGLFAMQQPDPTPPEDFFIKAAGQLALDYYFLERKNAVPFRWAPDAIEPVKCLFVCNNGVPRPFYHATYFQTRLPPTRVAAQTDLDAKGMGLGTLAGGSSPRVAVLACNYQWKNSQVKEFNLCLDNLPPAFRQKSIQVKLHAVRLGRIEGEAEIEVSETVGAAGRYMRRIRLNPNEFIFLELTAN